MCLKPESRAFFKPSKVPQLRCRRIGYTSHTPCIRAIPHLNEQEGKAITKLMIAMRHKFTRNSNILLNQGTMELPSRKFTFRGAVPDAWQQRQTLFPEVKAQEVDEWLASIASPSSPPCKSTLLLKCPECYMEQDCTNRTLTRGTAWKQVQCKSFLCRASRTAVKWLCTCGKPW